MSFDWLLGSLALMLIMEALLPFFSPAAWRKTFERMLKLSDGQLRFVGLLSLIAGLSLLWVALPG